ncbi:hypothetical protein NE865_06458 [Phthorimaea operculella]|nr:hypothetical protein NE865_06458 [Phthorimaea operculella]
MISTVSAVPVQALIDRKADTGWAGGLGGLGRRDATRHCSPPPPPAEPTHNKQTKMKCGRVQLQERAKIKIRDVRPVTSDKPRRYCQKRLVNPQHEEDPRWIDVLERFRCNEPILDTTGEDINEQIDIKQQDLFLSVQTLKFKGAEQHNKRPRTGFKYKTVPDGHLHRMFVKQTVTNDDDPSDDDRSSQLTCYYYDDYAKYLSNADRSRPSSAKSSIFLQGLSTRFKANKSVQVDLPKTQEPKKIIKNKKTDPKEDVKAKDESDAISSDDTVKDTKVSYHTSGKRKSLTISRTQSPETVQVIRVDVVCNNNSSSTTADFDDIKSPKDITERLDKKTNTAKLKDYNFASKYLLTNTVKSLEEHVSGGAKVTLLCKTFKLTDRSKMLFNRKPFEIAKVTSNAKVNK